MTNTFLSALVNSAIAAALLTAAVRFGLLLIPRTILRAAARYVIWWTILVSTLLLPLAYLPRHPLDTTVHFAAALHRGCKPDCLVRPHWRTVSNRSAIRVCLQPALCYGDTTKVGRS